MNDEVNLEVETCVIEAKTRKLKGDWYFEPTHWDFSPNTLQKVWAALKNESRFDDGNKCGGSERTANQVTIEELPVKSGQQ